VSLLYVESSDICKTAQISEPNYEQTMKMLPPGYQGFRGCYQLQIGGK
jgi:hypothetical protein